MANKNLLDKFLAVLTLAALFFAGWALYDEYQFRTFVLYENSDDFFKFENPTEKEIERYIENVDRVYREDTYGGKTPQETFDMFKAALKAGDIELAAKYFVPEKQATMLSNFRIGIQKNTMPEFITYLDRAISGRPHEYKHHFYTVDKNNVLEMDFLLFFNKQAKIWKMESL